MKDRNRRLREVGWLMNGRAGLTSPVSWLLLSFPATLLLWTAQVPSSSSSSEPALLGDFPATLSLHGAQVLHVCTLFPFILQGCDGSATLGSSQNTGVTAQASLPV